MRMREGWTRTLVYVPHLDPQMSRVDFNQAGIRAALCAWKPALPAGEAEIGLRGNAQAAFSVAFGDHGEHPLRDGAAGARVLPGHEPLVVDRAAAERRRFLEPRPQLLQPAFQQERHGVGQADLLFLGVGEGVQPHAADQRAAVGALGSDQARRAVAHCAQDPPLAVRRREQPAQVGVVREVPHRAVPAGQEHSGVSPRVQLGHRNGLPQLARWPRDRRESAPRCPAIRPDPRQRTGVVRRRPPAIEARSTW